MNAPVFSARRATVDDLEGLRALWRAEQLPELELERRITEFQVALDAENRVLGAIGLGIAGTQGCLHSETFSDFGLADALRPLLWERVQTVARNRGLTRLWTREKTLFWRGEGFGEPDGEAQEKFPPAFGTAEAEWFTLKLKDDLLAALTPEQQAAIHQAISQDSAEKMAQQAHVLKWVAFIVGGIVFGLLAYVTYSMIRIMGHRNGGRPLNYLPGSRR